MSSVQAAAINNLFFERIENPQEKTKVAELTNTYIRDRLREVSFARKITPTQNITRAECQRSVHHDTLVKIVDIEPNSRAMSMGFRGQPTARMIKAERFEIPFFTISSEKFEKTEQELLAYEMPITKIVEENTIKDIQEIEDRCWLLHVEACVQAYQMEVSGGSFSSATKVNATNIKAGTAKQYSVWKSDGAIASSTDDFEPHPILKPDLLKLKKALHRRRLRAERLLITEPDYDDLSAWTIQDVGHQIAGETSVEGWKANTVVGLKIIRTIKTDILREGNIYCFTAPEFFGRFYVLNQTKFYIDKVANLITWQSWEDIGMGFANCSAVVKLETYSGSVSYGFEDTGFEAAIPVAEEELAKENNRVGKGMTFPQVDTF